MITVFVKFKNNKDPTWYKVLDEKRDEYLINLGAFGTYVRKDEMLTYQEYMKQFVNNSDEYNYK